MPPHERGDGFCSMTERFIDIFRLFRRLGTALLLALAVLPATPAAPVSAVADAPSVVDGELDLRNWDFEIDGSLDLDGEWIVYRDQLLDPLAAIASTGTATAVPDVWGPVFTLTPATGYGEATYRLRIHVPPGQEQLALRAFRMRSIMEIYAYVPGPDGSAGRTYLLVRPKDYQRQEDLHAGPIYLPFTAETFDLVFLIKNNSHKQGGIIESPVLGLRGVIEAAAGRDRNRVAAFVTLLLFGSVIGLTLGVALRGGRSFNLFALAGILAASRIVTTSQLFGDYFPELPLTRKYDLEYLTLFLSMPVIYGFISSLFPKESSRIFQLFLNFVCGSMAVYALLFAPTMLPGSVTLLREPFLVIAATMLLMAGATCVRAYLNQRRGARLAVACMLALAVSGFLEISYYLGLASYAINGGHLGITLVSILFMIGVLYRYRQMQLERETQNVQLQELNANLEHRTRELEVANRKATAASEAKSNFLAVLSHEIRTPLTGMIGMTGVLENEVASGEHSRLMAAVRRSGEGLLNLLNDMLDLSKIEAGAVELEKIPFTLSQLIDQINDLWQSPMREKKLAFNINCTYPADKALVADVGRIRQILHNLIGNARKFTDSGSVTVKIGGQETDDRHVQLEFSVIDTGIGVSPDKQEQIFGVFNQADSDTSRNYGGTGLGLAICKQFTELMGGGIGLESEPGKGSTFSLIIPCEIKELPAEEDTAEEKTDKPGRSLHILVAEDVSLNQEVIRRMLGSLGHDVTIVEDGQEAVNTCKEIEYDLVLMDLKMPELDGFSATRMIRALSLPISGVPILALTANVGDDVRRAVETAGMDGFIAKPIELVELRRAIGAVANGECANTSTAAKQD